MKTLRNGNRPFIKYRLNITIRLTHSVMISRAVESTALGLNVSNIPSMPNRFGFGQPSVLIGQSALENHVSRTSESCVNPAAFKAGMSVASSDSGGQTKTSIRPSGSVRRISAAPRSVHAVALGTFAASNEHDQTGMR